MKRILTQDLKIFLINTNILMVMKYIIFKLKC